MSRGEEKTYKARVEAGTREEVQHEGRSGWRLKLRNVILGRKRENERTSVLIQQVGLNVGQ
jgi:hypothetical protein